MKNLFYWSYFFVIGGVETFIYEMAKKYSSTHEMVVVYKDAEPEQLERLNKFVRTVKFTGQHFTCDKAIFGLNTDIIDYIDAKEYIQVLHADFVAQHLTPSSNPKITKFIGVSQNTCDGVKEVYGIDAECIYNPLQVEKPKKKLRLVSAMRNDPQKAPWRVVALANALDKAGVYYEWQIFIPTPIKGLNSPNIVYRPTTFNITDEMANADFLVQLSEAEGYSYSMIESLCVGTPLITTPLPMNKEAGIVDGKNAIIIPFDMSDIPIERIVKKLPRVKYTPHPDRWNEILAEGTSDYAEIMKKFVNIKVKKIYKDILLDREVRPGEILAVTGERAIKLVSMDLAEFVDQEDKEAYAV